MHDRRNFKIAFASLVVVIVLLSLWANSAKTTDKAQHARLIPVSVVQFDQKLADGRLAIELKCESAQLLADGSLKGFRCNLKNNAITNLQAATLNYSVVLSNEDAGMSTKDSHWLTVDTLIDPHLQSTSNAIKPNEEVPLTSPKLTYGAQMPIKEIEVSIDYVEYDDGVTGGPNRKGSRIISDMREGATKFKNWLIQQTKEGKTPSTLLGTDGLPNKSDGVVFANFDQESGARGYKIRLRKIRAAHGDAEVRRLLRP